MPSYYFKCDSCGKTYDGEPLTRNTRHNYHGVGKCALIEEAKARGWLIKSEHSWDNVEDLCPDCAKPHVFRADLPASLPLPGQQEPFDPNLRDNSDRDQSA